MVSSSLVKNNVAFLRTVFDAYRLVVYPGIPDAIIGKR
jgi:hypothetical protein